QARGGRLVCVFGCGGERDPASDPNGRIAVERPTGGGHQARGGRLVCVFGCGGERDPASDPNGRIAVERPT
ncbi:hypothetical protein CKW47_21495, partial [Bordetella pertussis]